LLNEWQVLANATSRHRLATAQGEGG
jgi:hypothetical protein